MVNIAISVTQELYNKMKRYSEVKWSEVVRKALTDYLGKLEMIESGIVSSEKLAAELKKFNIDVSCISLDKAIEYYEKGRKLEWKRLCRRQPTHKFS